jgi:glycine cleavage system aminomethyltransferase T
MSALAFLSPSGAADAKGFHPVARSAVARAQQEAGVVFAERGGWLVPVSHPDEQRHLEAVGVADLSHVTKLDVRPAGEAPEARAAVWYPLSPRRALCLCHKPELPSIREQLADRHVLDVTAAYVILALTGPEAGTVLRRVTHLHHFPSGGEVAHITAHVLEQPPGYWIVAPQEAGHYLWQVVVDRARALGGGPIGVDAL